MTLLYVIMSIVIGPLKAVKFRLNWYKKSFTIVRISTILYGTHQYKTD